MFTGIISSLGEVESITKFADNVVLVLKINTEQTISLGDSVACDGVCLTVSAILSDSVYQFNVSTETLSCTNLKFWVLGYKCNIELAATMVTRLGGHLVSGHVDGLAQITDIKKCDDYWQLQLRDLSNNNLWVNKGSLAINGVSLTINNIIDSTVELMLVPHTIANTNLQFLSAEQLVNIEFDMIYKMVKSRCDDYLRVEK